MTRRAQEGERGAVAIVVAVTATMLFAMAALAVDLGSGFARKRDIQTQADLAALAAAAELPYNGDATAIAAAARKYAVHNEVLGQAEGEWNFTDADRTNGYLEFVGSDKVRLYAPRSTVNFWLAPVVGLPRKIDINAIAAAQIETPGKGLPFFLSVTCGWGQQTILDQTQGPEIPPDYVPALAPTTEQSASADMDTIDPDSVNLDDVNGDGIGETTTVLTIAGNSMNNVNRVGFTIEDGGTETAVPVSNSASSVTVVIPDAVDTTEAVWWVRVQQGNQNRWSAAADALPLIVGDPADSSLPPGSCDSKNSGNFGSIELSRDDVVKANWLEENMALGIQHDLDKYPVVAPTPPDGCADEAEAVVDSGQPMEGERLNCLVTDTGSDLAAKATDAFITGTAQGSAARLDRETTVFGDSPEIGCAPDGGSDERKLSDIPGSPEINNDVLSCFITGGYSVEDVTQQTLAPEHEHVLAPEIFDSPRFFYVPVLVADPTGGAGSYAIIDMRPVFITDQPPTATRDDSGLAAEADNGLVMSGNGKSIEKIQVIAIHPDALPEFAPSDVEDSMPWIGSGTKVIRLVE